MATANAQPAVMQIQPAEFPFVLVRTMFATTPLPNRMSRAVPTTSARYECMQSGGVEMELPNGKPRHASDCRARDNTSSELRHAKAPPRSALFVARVRGTRVGLNAHRRAE